jgi:mono/diheme cytochrome c family protein
MGTMRGYRVALLVVVVAVLMGVAARGGGRAWEPGVGAPHVSAETSVAAGRYLVVAGGCNDCHTPGWSERNGDVPESDWLTGASLGFKGPWGTSYPRNLRLSVATMTEDAFLARLKAGAGLPPMPWMNVSRLAEDDMRAIYRFIASLGPAGEVVPQPVAAGVEPETPYILFEAVMPHTSAH